MFRITIFINIFSPLSGGIALKLQFLNNFCRVSAGRRYSARRPPERHKLKTQVLTIRGPYRAAGTHAIFNIFKTNAAASPRKKT
jgi:hypothetical protein